mmetsp:Transcript_58892/g.129280  ORF Transcript_58892/g.129280 Transcript_58892/m.129280 type:complete len:88 (-) Transcript_58892:17-280(-)
MTTRRCSSNLKHNEDHHATLLIESSRLGSDRTRSLRRRPCAHVSSSCDDSDDHLVANACELRSTVVVCRKCRDCALMLLFAPRLTWR